MGIRSWSTNVGICNKPEALRYVFAREETTKHLRSFEVAHLSFERWERFLLAGTKRTLALSRSREMVVQRRLLAA